jgi:hypothetical protein
MIESFFTQPSQPGAGRQMLGLINVHGFEFSPSLQENIKTVGETTARFKDDEFAVVTQAVHSRQEFAAALIPATIEAIPRLKLDGRQKCACLSHLLGLARGLEGNENSINFLEQVVHQVSLVLGLQDIVNVVDQLTQILVRGSFEQHANWADNMFSQIMSTTEKFQKFPNFVRQYLTKVDASTADTLITKWTEVLSTSKNERASYLAVKCLAAVFSARPGLTKIVLPADIQWPKELLAVKSTIVQQ